MPDLAKHQQAVEKALALRLDELKGCAVIPPGWPAPPLSADLTNTFGALGIPVFREYMGRYVACFFASDLVDTATRDIARSAMTSAYSSREGMLIHGGTYSLALLRIDEEDLL